VAIDQFKTQVLLLHSEQSTLDELGSRFNDRYTVHFATSGSQALGTLADTPIDVIISAQDLPGMSGLEALREARKRSPDTIGILLTGNDEDGSEAFVGDEEVFHVVRGSVSKDELLQLVDSATRKMRLMTLAESANDTKALAEDSGDHIATQTDAQALPVSTSASGRMPALDPAMLASLKPVDVLVLTRDDQFLQTVQASSRGLHTVHSAPALSAASAVMQQEEIGVVVIDSAMVRDKVEQLTQHLRQEVPRLVAIVAGRRDDGDMLMELLNRGVVYRFLVKPVTPGRARLAVEAAVKYHLEAPDAAFGRPDSDASIDSESHAADVPDNEARHVDAEPQQSEPAAKAATDTQADREPAEPDPDQARLDQTINTTQRMQKLAAARLESRAVATGYYPKLAAVAVAVIVLVVGAWLWFAGDTAEQPATVEPEVASQPGTAPAEAAVAGSVDRSIDEPAGEPMTDAAIVVTPSAADSGDLDVLLSEARAARDAGAIYEPRGDNAIELYRYAVTESDGAAVVVEEFESIINEALALAEAALLEARLDDAALALQRVEQADADNPRLPFLLAQLQQAQLLKTLGEARAAIHDMRLEDAATLLAVANAYPAGDRSDIKAVAAELDRVRSELLTDRMLARAESRLEAGDLLTPANKNARYYFELVLSKDPDNQAALQGLNVIASRLILQARASIDDGDFGRAEMLLGEVRILDPRNSQLQATAEALDSRRSTALAENAAAAPAGPVKTSGASALPETGFDVPTATPGRNTDTATDTLNATPVAVSSLVRTRYVAPKYPRSAQRRRLSGWVDVEFTVGVDGTVKDVHVRSAEPGDTFDNAAVSAVGKWEFEPVLENGSAVERRAAVRMLFALE
jgi:TonB family protein